MTVVYGSSVADTTLTNACKMSAMTGGTETSRQTTTGAGGKYAEIQSQGGSHPGTTSIPSPTGKGWVYSPGAGTFATGNWSARVTLQFANIDPSGSTTTIRFYRYSGGVYTQIGTITTSTTTTAKSVRVFSATSMSSVTFGASDLLYVDLWMFDGGADADSDNPTVYVSNSSTAGVVDDLQITTSTFTPSGGGVFGDGMGGMFK